MRYRQLAPNGDSTIFSGNSPFLVNSPAAVAQAIGTRLKLWLGEWFLDSTVGFPVYQQVIGTGTQDTRDLAVQATILGTTGVLSITGYSSVVLPGRKFVVSVDSVETIYGSIPFTITL
jgi:hypothetical protein